LRRLRIVAPAQLRLSMEGLAHTPAERWAMLPAPAQESIVCILARMIAAGVIEIEEAVTDDSHH
jgi:hypothetical protein